MKKFFSIFACVILLISVCAFPMFAADKQTEMNINDMIFLYNEDGLKSHSDPWYFSNRGGLVDDKIENDFDKFLSVILLNSSLDPFFCYF